MDCPRPCSLNAHDRPGLTRTLSNLGWLIVSRQGLALIYPSLRDRGVPRLPSPQYAYPDAAGREAAWHVTAAGG